MVDPSNSENELSDEELAAASGGATIFSDEAVRSIAVKSSQT